MTSLTGNRGVDPDYYADVGCDISPLCIECPLARCKFDNQKTTLTDWSSEAKRQLYKDVYRRRNEGASLRQLHREFGISDRTIYRIMERKGVLPVSGPYPQGGLSNEPPAVDPCELKPHDFKPGKPPALYDSGGIGLYQRSCPHCNGTVMVDFRAKDADCLSCHKDPRKRIGQSTPGATEQVLCEGSGIAVYMPREGARHCAVCDLRVSARYTLAPAHYVEETV